VFFIAILRHGKVRANRCAIIRALREQRLSELPRVDRDRCINPKLKSQTRVDYSRPAAVTHVKIGTFLEFQLYMVCWQTPHLA
jgi:hypothetical protein